MKYICRIQLKVQAVIRMHITRIREQDNIATLVQHILANSQSQEPWDPLKGDEAADRVHD